MMRGVGGMRSGVRGEAVHGVGGVLNIVDWGGFGQLRNFCNFWTRKLSLNSSYGLGILTLRQPFRTMSCRKFGSKINVGMSGFFFKFVIFRVNSDTFD